MKQIPFRTNSYTEELFFIVPDGPNPNIPNSCGYDEVIKSEWRMNQTLSGGKVIPRYYVVRSATEKELKEGWPMTIYLHRFLCGLKKGAPGNVDHINTKNTLDNDWSNLQITTPQGNSRNRSDKRSGTLWGCNSVSDKGPNPWESSFALPRNGKKSIKQYNGRYKTELEAHIASCDAWLELFGTSHSCDTRKSL